MATPKKATTKPAVKGSTKAGSLNKHAASSTPGIVGGYSYPGGFPYESVKEVVRLVRENKLSDNKAVFGKHVWVVQGYAMSMLLGDPDSQQKLDFNMIGKKDIAPQDDMVVDILNSMLESHNKNGGLSPQALDGGTIVKFSAPAAMSSLLRWAVTKLFELLEQELAGAIV